MYNPVAKMKEINQVPEDILDKVQTYYHIAASEKIHNKSNMLNDFLIPYEEGFMADALYYQFHPECLLKKSKGGFLFGDEIINKFQFQSNGEDSDFWVVYMDLKKLKESETWFPKELIFAQMYLSQANLERVAKTWICEPWVLHPSASSTSYDYEKLNENLISVVRIIENDQAKIQRVRYQYRDAIEGATIKQEIDLNISPNFLSSRGVSKSVVVLKSIFDDLPINKIKRG